MTIRSLIREELKRARAVFDNLGYLPYAVVSRLHKLGIAACVLEAQWSSEAR